MTVSFPQGVVKIVFFLTVNILRLILHVRMFNQIVKLVDPKRRISHGFQKLSIFLYTIKRNGFQTPTGRKARETV